MLSDRLFSGFWSYIYQFIKPLVNFVRNLSGAVAHGTYPPNRRWISSESNLKRFDFFEAFALRTPFHSRHSCSDTKLVLGNDFPYYFSFVFPNLATKGKGRFVNRPTVTGGKKYDKFFIYVPTEVAKDSQFPFKTGDFLEIKIDTVKKHLIVKHLV